MLLILLFPCRQPAIYWGEMKTKFAMHSSRIAQPNFFLGVGNTYACHCTYMRLKMDYRWRYMAAEKSLALKFVCRILTNLRETFAIPLAVQWTDSVD